MSNIISNLLNLIIVPFKDNNIFVITAGLLCVSWLFRSVYDMIRGTYYG